MHSELLAQYEGVDLYVGSFVVIKNSGPRGSVFDMCIIWQIWDVIHGGLILTVLVGPG